MVAIAEAISESKHGGRRQLRRTSVCSAVNPRFCSFSRLFVGRCSLTVDEGQDPAIYPGAAAHPRLGASAGFRGVDAKHNCGKHRSPPLNPGAAALSRGVGTGFRGADAEHNCGEHCSPPLNINGANTYQFVMSNPVGNVDPWGLSAIYDEMMGGSSPPGPAGGAGTISVYVVDRSAGRNTGFTGGHIDMVIPGVGVVGYYGTIPPGAGWAQAHGLGIPGFWNDSYNDFQGSRPMYVNPPGTGGYLSTIVKVPVTPEQLKRMRGELKELEAHPGNFNIITNNCAENALKVLSAGGIDPNPWYHFGFDNPQDLVDQLNQEGDKEFNGYTVENPSGSVTIIPVLPAPAPAKAPGSSGGQAKC